MKTTYDNKEVRIATGGKDHDGVDGPAVVLLHGAGMDRTTWQMQSRWLSHHGYRVAAIDLPGHGLSEGPPLETISEMAAWTAGVVRQLDLAPAHIVGFSMGTFIGLDMAAEYPDTVASLVLIGTASAMPVHPVLLDASRDDVPRASRLMTSWGIGSKAHRGGHQSPGTWLIGTSTALLDTSPEGALLADMVACNAYGDGVEHAREIDAPVTFLLGKEDKMTPIKASHDLVDAVKNKQVITLDSIGHMMPIEDPIGARKAIDGGIRWALEH
ncbi:MAG: alpha/beta hydrolase [Acidimicrobiales bacterium]|nr:alpha/beta hydrolase [Acidimicrobiales bacterium]RZV42226.1 MAG: alpha/beta hydrolase [Acidimicrobiales bacterium]